MSKHKNLIMILGSIILIAYAAMLSIYPALLSSSFNKDEFCEKVYKACGLVTTLDSIEFKMKPSLTLVITINNWSSKYIDRQDCFDAVLIELQTGAFSPFTKNFKIKEMFLKHVKFSNQTLPNGENKLAYLPKSFEASAFGSDKITVEAGPVKVLDFKIKNIAPKYYDEDNRSSESYSKLQVKDFLLEQNIRFVTVK